MQCNTNYTGSDNNFKFINLNVLKTYSQMFPDLVLGLSDHTPRHSTVLGAITLGARIIEKHFTDDNSREGPDHYFAMNHISWKEMISRARELEDSLGSQIKRIEYNEKETVVLQRRSIRVKEDMKQGSVINNNHLIELRPCPNDAIPPYEIDKILGMKLNNAKRKGDYLKWKDLH